jgi:hypothetical protein
MRILSTHWCCDYVPVSEVIPAWRIVIVWKECRVHIGQLRVVSLVDPVVGTLLPAACVPPSVLRILPGQLLHYECVLVQTVHADQVCFVCLKSKSFLENKYMVVIFFLFCQPGLDM